MKVNHWFKFVARVLVENACLYTSDGGQITISAEGDGEYVKFSVQDTGIGIQQDDQSQVFRFLFRAQDELVQKHYGNGISLYIAQHVIRALGGQIWFESEYGKGSTFHFTVPIAK